MQENSDQLDQWVDSESRKAVVELLNYYNLNRKKGDFNKKVRLTSGEVDVTLSQNPTRGPTYFFNGSSLVPITSQIKVVGDLRNSSNVHVDRTYLMNSDHKNLGYYDANTDSQTAIDLTTMNQVAVAYIQLPQKNNQQKTVVALEGNQVVTINQNKKNDSTILTIELFPNAKSYEQKNDGNAIKPIRKTI